MQENTAFVPGGGGGGEFCPGLQNARWGVGSPDVKGRVGSGGGGCSN